MDSFIKKIFETKENDELVHLQFVKFGKGEFPERAMIRAKSSKEKYDIATTSEYSKEIIISIAEKLKDRVTQVSGAIISMLDLEGFDYKEKKMAMGVRKYIIEKEMSGNQIIELCNKTNKAFFALSFSTENTILNIKPKSPKSVKRVTSQKKEDEKAKIDFIKIKTTDKDLVDSLIFDDEANGFKKIEIKHDFIINDIVMPKDVEASSKEGMRSSKEGMRSSKEEIDFAKIRELTKRKGKIIRYLDIDGNKIKKEMMFEA